MNGDLTLLIGAAKSGKSTFAEELAEQNGDDVVFIATGKEVDEEMKMKIEQHKESRNTDWVTIEADGDIPTIIENLRDKRQAGEKNNRTILIDCISFYVADLMNTHEKDEDEILAHFDQLRKKLNGEESIIMVSTEVGAGLVPPFPMGRKYRDTLGKINQLMAGQANTVFMLVAGIPMRIKSRAG